MEFSSDIPGEVDLDALDSLAAEEGVEDIETARARMREITEELLRMAHGNADTELMEVWRLRRMALSTVIAREKCRRRTNGSVQIFNPRQAALVESKARDLAGSIGMPPTQAQCLVAELMAESIRVQQSWIREHHPDVQCDDAN